MFVGFEKQPSELSALLRERKNITGALLRGLPEHCRYSFHE
jgi:hypothetical protein